MRLDELVDGAPPPDFRRDQWGRPYIMQPDGKRKGYTRCSAAAKTIEDTFNLEKWARRNIAYGMAYDPSLVARIIAIGGEPSTWGKPEKEQVNAILDAADAVAKAHKRADIGTSVHHLTHRVDRGETVNAGPYQADIDAYRRALDTYGLTPIPELIECRMVNDDLEMAGTTDRIFPNGGELHVVADIKTGATIDFGGLGWAAQLAAYAGANLYDVTTEQRLATPPINRNIGLIIHLPAGEGRCDIYHVDIEQGLVAARLANDIRAVRKASKSWIVPAKSTSAATGSGSSTANTSTPNGDSKSPKPSSSTSSVSPIQTNTADAPKSSSSAESDGREAAAGPLPRGNSAEEEWRFEAKRRYDALNDVERAAYTARKRDIDTSDPAAVFALLDEIDAFNNVNVPAPEPAVALPPAPVQPPTPDEGPLVDDTDIKALRSRFEQLPTDAQLWIGILTAQGTNAGVDWRTNVKPSVRRYELGRGVVRLAQAGDDWATDQVIRDILTQMNMGNDYALIGALLGQLNADQAAQFAATVDDYLTAGGAA